MYGTELQILLIEPSAETAAQIVRSLDLKKSLSPFALEVAADAPAAIKSLRKQFPACLILANPKSFNDPELSQRLHARQSPVVAYVPAPGEYAELLELHGVFERVLLTPTVLSRLPVLISQWWHRWQVQQSRNASGRQLPQIQKFTESLSVGACVIDRNRHIRWSNAISERLLAMIATGPDGPHRIPAPAALVGVSPVEIIREIRRHGHWQGELAAGLDPGTRVSITATCQTNGDGRITEFSILTQTIVMPLREQTAEQMADQRSAARSRLDRLSPREREVLQLVTAGYSNSDTATRLGLSKKTIEKHRARLMSKVAAGSLAELVQMVVTVNGGPTISLQEAESPVPVRRGSQNPPPRELQHAETVAMRNL